MFKQLSNQFSKAAIIAGATIAPFAGQADKAEAAVIPVICGDFNGDGTVNGADLTKWKTNFGTGTPPGITYDGDSFLCWQRNFGATFPATPAFNATTSATPEPSSAVLGITAAAFGALALRKREPSPA